MIFVSLYFRCCGILESKQTKWLRPSSRLITNWNVLLLFSFAILHVWLRYQVLKPWANIWRPFWINIHKLWISSNMSEGPPSGGESSSKSTPKAGALKDVFKIQKPGWAKERSTGPFRALNFELFVKPVSYAQFELINCS